MRDSDALMGLAPYLLVNQSLVSLNLLLAIFDFGDLVEKQEFVTGIKGE